MHYTVVELEIHGVEVHSPFGEKLNTRNKDRQDQEMMEDVLQSQEQ